MDSDSTYHHIRSGLSISISQSKHPPLGSKLLFILFILLLRLPNDKAFILLTILNHVSLLPTAKASSSLSIAWPTPMLITTSRTYHIRILCCLPFIMISSKNRPLLCLVTMSTITPIPLPLLFPILMKLSLSFSTIRALSTSSK